MIDDEQQKLNTDLDETKASYEQFIGHLTEEITQAKSSLESLMKYNSELLLKGTTTDITRQANSIRKRSFELRSTENIEDAFGSYSDIHISLSLTKRQTINILGTLIKAGSIPSTYWQIAYSSTICTLIIWMLVFDFESLCLFSVWCYEKNISEMRSID